MLRKHLCLVFLFFVTEIHGVNLDLNNNVIPQPIIEKASKYGPIVRLHSNDKFRPSSVSWYVSKTLVVLKKLGNYWRPIYKSGVKNNHRMSDKYTKNIHIRN